MLIRQITVATEPAQLIQLYFDSRSNAERDFEKTSIDGRVALSDDYQQKAVFRYDLIAADVIVDMGEQLRATGEMEIVKLIAQEKFDNRVEHDKIVKVMAAKKRAAQTMQTLRQGGQVQMPNGAA